MVAPDQRRIIQAVCLIEEKMKGFQRDVRSRCLAEKPVYFDKMPIPGTGRIRDDQDRVTTFLRIRIVVNLPMSAADPRRR